MKINEIFESLNVFKDLPGYQLERRVDAFMLPYLEEAFNGYFALNDIVFLYPEFPIRPIGQNFATNKKNSRNSYVDYLLWSKNINTIFFVELKTDNNSVDKDQLGNYLDNCTYKWGDFLLYLYDKSLNTTDKEYRKKYQFSLKYINKIEPNLFVKNNIKYISMTYGDTRHKKKIIDNSLKEFEREIELMELNPLIKTIYLAPESSRKEVESFVDSKNAKDYFYGFFPICKFAEYTDDPLKKLLLTIG